MRPWPFALLLVSRPCVSLIPLGALPDRREATSAIIYRNPLLAPTARDAVRGKIKKGFRHLKGLMAGHDPHHHHGVPTVIEEATDEAENRGDEDNASSIADDESKV